MRAERFWLCSPRLKVTRLRRLSQSSLLQSRVALYQKGVPPAPTADATGTRFLTDPKTWPTLGQQQVVVKNLEANYRRVPDVSGATILGDGRVALILDVGSLVRRSGH